MLKGRLPVSNAIQVNIKTKKDKQNANFAQVELILVVKVKAYVIHVKKENTNLKRVKILVFHAFKEHIKTKQAQFHAWSVQLVNIKI